MIGKLDANADHRAGALWIDAIHEDEPFGRSVRSGVEREIRSLAALLNLEPRYG